MESPTVQETTALLSQARYEQVCPEHTDAADFAASFEANDPLNWSWLFKWSIMALLAFTACTISFACTSVVPIASRIVEDLDGDDRRTSAIVLMVTIWELGEATGPILIAPLSEVFGRYPLMNIANVFFILAASLAALSDSTETLIAARALTGMAVGTNVLNPAIVGDLLPQDQRGTAMSLILFAPIIGGAIGPVFGGAVAETLGWRAVLWTSVGLACLCESIFLLYFRETYKPCIMRKQMASLGQKGVSTAGGSASGERGRGNHTNLASLGTSISRPILMLFSSGILASLSLFGAITFAYYYVVIVTLPAILRTTYEMSPASIGTAFLATSFGSFVGFLICNLSLDRIYIKLGEKSGGERLPEYRLPMAILGAFLMPPSVALYGWCAHHELPLGLLLSSVICICMSFMLSILPLMSYVVDAYGFYSASALTGVIITRCLAGAFLPLVSTVVVEQLAYGWGFTLLAGVSFILAFIPVLILRYGSHWRQKSEYTRTFQQL